MKKLVTLIYVLTFTAHFSYAQTDAGEEVTAIGLGATSTNSAYKFPYQSNLIAHYGLGWYLDNDFAGGPMAYLGGYGGIKFFTEGSPRLLISAGGNVGIGTTNPDQKLTVNGTIHAKQVNVDVNVPVPDYVFEKNYPLKPLAEVKKYVDANKHLPEIPAAAVIEKNGINVTELNMQMLKKIEELTLYLIKQDKEIKKLKKQVSTLTKYSR